MAETTAVPTEAASQAARSERRPEMDVLTTLIVGGLMFFHTASIFSGQQLVVNKAQSGLTGFLAGLVVLFEFLWIMPALMFVAGIAIWYSLRRRTASEFVRERLLRLGVPFLTGLVLLNPPQVYYYLLQRTNGPLSFWQFYPRYWNIKFSLLSFPYFLEAAGPEQTFGVGYLWFLIYLLVYTLLLLPLFLYLRTPAGERLVERAAGFFSRGLAIFLLAIPIALLEAIFAASWQSGWNRWIWPFIILYGYLFAADPRLTQALVRHRTLALVLGLVGFLVVFLGFGMLMGMQIDAFTNPGGPAMIVRLVKGTSAWLLVVGFVGLATHLGQRGPRARPGVAAAEGAPSGTPHEAAGQPTFWARLAAYGREAQLPYYVLHQLPIIVIGFYVVQWNMAPLWKLLIISLPSLALTLLVYEFVVRRTIVTRFLFGLRLRPRPDR